MELSTLLQDSLFRSAFSAKNTTVTALCEEEHETQKDSAFILLKRNRKDLKHILEEAEKKEVAAIVAEESEKDLPTSIPCFYVSDIRRTCAFAWSRFYGEPQKKLSLTAITGTNGKTSTARFLSYLYNAVGIHTGYIGTVGIYDGEKSLSEGQSTLTTPSPKHLFHALDDFTKRGITHAVLEVSSHALHQERTAPLQFDTAIFTNLSEDHLDYHKTMEEYFLTKARLFTSCKQALINTDDAYGERLFSMLRCPKYSFAILRSADFHITDLHEKDASRTQYTCVFPTGEFSVDYPLFGAFNTYNTLAALSAALLYGIAPKKLTKAMYTLPRVKGRLEELHFKKNIPFSVVIDYAHTPDAMAQAIATVKRKTKGKLYVLFGAGGEREREKRAKMGEIAETYADFVFLSSDNSRKEPLENILSDIISGMKKKEKRAVIQDRKAAIHSALAKLKNGDTLLLLGKGHEEYIMDQNGRHPFSETEIVEKWIEEQYGI